MDRKEFNAFARSLDLRERTPGLQGIGWHPFVTDGQRAAFLATGQFRAQDLLDAAMAETWATQQFMGVELDDEAVPDGGPLASDPAGFGHRGPTSSRRSSSSTAVPSSSAWRRCRAARSGEPVCLALLDLDHFKDDNDRHGHQAGDRFLKEAAAGLVAVVRKTDLVARKAAGRNRTCADAAPARETAAP